MKLLLTSMGLTNEAIIAELKRLLGAPFNSTKLLYCPTAATFEPSLKEWSQKNMERLSALGFDVIACDISAIDKDEALQHFHDAKILYFDGGNTQALMNSITAKNIAKELQKMLTEKIWVGVSAGSLILCPAVYQTSEHWFIDNPPKPIAGLGAIDFQFIPHLNNPDFKQNRKENIRFFRDNLAINHIEKALVVDDETAISVDDVNINIVGPGDYFTI